MKIIVLVKEVPDTYGDRTLDLETGLAGRADSPAVLDEIAERAIDLAMTEAQNQPDSEVTLLCMGPASAATNLRKGLAMGAHRAVHIHDSGLLGADLGLTAEVLAAAIRRVGFDLIICGNLSTDGSGGVIPAMLAEHLGVSQLTGLAAVELGDATITGTRMTDHGVVSVTASLPAVISITEGLPDPRLPTFKGLMAAKKKPLDSVTLTELGVMADDPETPRSIITAVSERPARSSGVKITDDGDAGLQLAKFLVDNELV